MADQITLKYYDLITLHAVFIFLKLWGVRNFQSEHTYFVKQSYGKISNCVFLLHRMQYHVILGRTLMVVDCSMFKKHVASFF